LSYLRFNFLIDLYVFKWKLYNKLIYMSYYKNSEARKCCQELNKRKKMMEMNLRSESMGSELFVFLFNFHASYLHEWREEYSDDIINCPSCSHFRDKLPIGMFIELDFVSLGNINIADQPFLPNYKPRQIIKQYDT